ncbi:MAG: trypsin-like peptidase domain-containing protein [Bacilli bacterium]|nr:trypsin-like peptidase domain-containing protein [Bacilli bacterium]MBN2877784.1 trypsin-like peptidase domain-containing protein [Bacilli bacterium]
MKRVLILSVLLLFITIGVAINQVKGTDATSLSTQDSTTTTALFQTYYNGEYYYYTDYQDLISQIYDDVYQQVYDEMFTAIMAEVDNSFYEDIYTQVENNLANILTEEQIQVYLADFETQIHAVLEHAANSVFGVSSNNPDTGLAVGSGAVIRYVSTVHKYYLLTNYHVVENYLSYVKNYPDKAGDASVYVVFPDGSQRRAVVLGYDTEVDLAVLTFDSTGLDYVEVSTFADTVDINVSDFVLAVGNPLGYDFYNSATLGIISGLNRKVDLDRYVDYVQHDAEINGGNSGGPIYNLNGEIVGINVSKLATIDIEGIGFAIPVDIVQRVLSRIYDYDLLNHTIMPRLNIGYTMVEDIIKNNNIVLSSFTYNGTTYTDVSIALPSGVTNGAFVTSVDDFGSTYQKINVGDLIVRVGSFDITDKESFIQYVYDNYECGDTITFYYYEFQAVSSGFSDTLKVVTVTLI